MIAYITDEKGRVFTVRTSLIVVDGVVVVLEEDGEVTIATPFVKPSVDSVELIFKLHQKKDLDCTCVVPSLPVGYTRMDADKIRCVVCRGKIKIKINEN
jgi:hypothetical protein